MSGRSNQRGREWEDVCTASFDLLNGCSIIKTTAPVRVVSFNNRGQGRKNKGEFTGYFEARGSCDYEGGYLGRICSFEAKRTKDRRWYFKAIALHQQERMQQVDDEGGVSGVLLAWDHPEGTTAFFGIAWWFLVKLMESSKGVNIDTLLMACDMPNTGVMMLPGGIGGRYGRPRLTVNMRPFLERLQEEKELSLEART